MKPLLLAAAVVALTAGTAAAGSIRVYNNDSKTHTIEPQVQRQQQVGRGPRLDDRHLHVPLDEQVATSSAHGHVPDQDA
ncbi:MAG: hypothetical protein IPL61_39055 [Myxococcales bacterium]|nr:hypothetical protein [Myxococcales bacterium]